MSSLTWKATFERNRCGTEIWLSHPCLSVFIRGSSHCPVTRILQIASWRDQWYDGSYDPRGWRWSTCSRATSLGQRWLLLCGGENVARPKTSLHHSIQIVSAFNQWRLQNLRSTRLALVTVQSRLRLCPRDCDSRIRYQQDRFTADDQCVYNCDSCSIIWRTNLYPGE